MPKNNATSFVSIISIASISAAFVGLIALGSFDDPIRVFLAAVITFLVVTVSLLLLRLFQKDDDIKPGIPRLK